MDDIKPTIYNGGMRLMKNVMATAVTPPPAGYDSRLAYWEAVTGLRAGECAHEVCRRPATEGAIAIAAFSADRRRYIYPACETCARRTEMLYIAGPTVTLP